MALINDRLTVNSEKTLPLDRLAELEWMIAKEWIELVVNHRNKTLSSIALRPTRVSKNYWLELSVSSWTLPNMNWDSYLVKRLRQLRKNNSFFE